MVLGWGGEQGSILPKVLPLRYGVGGLKRDAGFWAAGLSGTGEPFLLFTGHLALWKPRPEILEQAFFQLPQLHIPEKPTL